MAENQALLAALKAKLNPGNADDNDQSEGCILDYESVRRIGEGSFGTVFAMKNKKTGEMCAVKEVYKRTLQQRHCEYLVKRERFALRRISSPYIIKLIDSFQDPLAIYFVMELMPNQTLEHHLRVNGIFRNDCLRFYAAEIIMALEYLQHVKIVHRDLKPENVLLDAKMHAKVSDFGYCVALEGGWRGLSRKQIEKYKQQKNSDLGTECYYAPEILDTAEVTFGTDLWCLGCMIYEFHTGKTAFQGGDDNHKYIKKGLYRSFPDGSDPYLMDLVKKLLKPKPEERLGMGDMGLLKTHEFFGTEDPETWDHLCELTPPPFKPGRSDKQFDLIDVSGGHEQAGPPEPQGACANPQERSASFGASAQHQPGASEPMLPQPPAIMSFDDMRTPPFSPPPRRKKKCCVVM